MSEQLERYRLKTGPACMYYMADFISTEEENSIVSKIPASRWTHLAHRRLQAIPTQLTPSNTLLASRLPDWLQRPVVERLNALEAFKYAPHGVNHCLINEYLPGQGIMPHEDGSAYYPVVATVSLGGTIVLDVAPKTTDESQTTHETASWRIVQEPRSLLITTGAAYTNTLHGIAEVEEDHGLDASSVANWHLLGNSAAIQESNGVNKRCTRISLTLRDVKRVSGSRLFGKPRS